MTERKFKQIAIDEGSNLLAVFDDGSLWRESFATDEWTRIPGPPADPVAKAEGELPHGVDVDARSGRVFFQVTEHRDQASRTVSAEQARAIASHLLAAADEAERGA